MKKFKKAAALIVALCVAASLAGCAGASPPSAAESQTPGSSAAASSPAATEAPAASPAASGEKQTLVVVTWGGALEDAIKASLEGFEAANNCTIQWETPTDYAKVKSMVETGNVQWDVITCDPDFIPRGGSQGLLEEIDYSIVDKTGIDPNYISQYGVGAYTWATVIGYNTDIYTKDTAPKTWADFWDTAKFKGNRAMYKSPYQTMEIALLADGVKKEALYPLDVDRALKSLDKIKGSVKVLWESGAQPQQLMASKEVDLAEAWAGRITAAKAEGAAVDIVYNEAVVTTDQWGVVKGTKHKDLAMKFLNAVTRAEAQAKFSKKVPYGPVNLDAYKLLDQSVIDSIPSAPKYAEQVVNFDMDYWAKNYDAVNEKFQSWLLS
jgi:putative spermidine/putrescine transport system substrate-binding protein